MSSVIVTELSDVNRTQEFTQCFLFILSLKSNLILGVAFYCHHKNLRLERVTSSSCLPQVFTC